MGESHTTYTSNYLSSTQSVLDAGNLLSNLLDADQETREYAVTQLERAAQRHQTGGAGYRGFMFSEIETSAAADRTLAPRATEDV